MKSKYKPIKWRDASEEIPKKEKPMSEGRYSVAVLVWWHWKNNSRESKDPRFGYYMFAHGEWQVMGIVGAIVVTHWAYANKPKLKASNK